MTTDAVKPTDVVAQLGLIDRYLPLWIILAMAVGIGLGRVFPGLGQALDTVKRADVSVPIAIGLFWMMFPVLAKVRYVILERFTLAGPLTTARRPDAR